MHINPARHPSSHVSAAVLAEMVSLRNRSRPCAVNSGHSAGSVLNSCLSLAYSAASRSTVTFVTLVLKILVHTSFRDFW